MKAFIRHSDGHGINNLHYGNVKRVTYNKDNNKCIVELHDKYIAWMWEYDKSRKPSNIRSEDKAKRFLQEYNVSTKPFVHVFYDVFEVEVEG